MTRESRSSKKQNRGTASAKLAAARPTSRGLPRIFLAPANDGDRCAISDLDKTTCGIGLAWFLRFQVEEEQAIEVMRIVYKGMALISGRICLGPVRQDNRVDRESMPRI